MPELPDDQVYELWTIQDTPQPAGTFTASDPTSVIALPAAAVSADQIAVTVEPAGGSDQPTSDPVMALPLT
jgi:anti-sigma-K factor RskA